MPGGGRGRPPRQIDEPPLEQGNIIKRSPMDNKLLVGRALNGHRVHHLHGLIHKVLRRTHALLQPEETSGEAHQRHSTQADEHPAKNGE